jgi:hypothetical protein
MSRDKEDLVDVGAPGLAAGPGPTPPGIDDGTPRATRATLGEDPPQSAEEQGEEAKVAERSAGTRGEQVGRAAGAPRRTPRNRGRRLR